MGASLFSANSISRFTLVYSDSAEIPFSPIRVEVTPQLTLPAAESSLSSQWQIITAFFLVLRRASLNTSLLSTEEPSSEKETTPSLINFSISVNSLPARSFVIAPQINTFTRALFLMISFSIFKFCGESIAGWVLGIARMLVTPPLSAAAVPLSIVSLSSLPGWRR